MKKLILAAALTLAAINAQAEIKNQIPTEAEFNDILYNHPDKKHISFDIDDGCNEVVCSATMYDAINVTKKGKIVSFTQRFVYFMWPACTKLKATDEPKQSYIEKSQFDCKKRSVRDWSDGGWAEYHNDDKVEKIWKEPGWDDWSKFDQHKGLNIMFDKLCK